MLSTILIIDKRVGLSTKYKKSLENGDVNVVVARALNEAISAIQKLEPDMIIVSDSIEEKLTGFCAKIRALTFDTRPVIIALSKSADAEHRIQVLKNGADDFLSEPVNIEEFKIRIGAHLRRDVESNLDITTLLPNQKIVRKTLKRALNSENQAVLLAGFENLKNYAEIYTEVAADKLIQTFVAITKSALDETDFFGRYDENNFVIVTNCFTAEKLAAFLVFAFDTVMPKFYSEADSKRGYTLLKGERYAGMRINFVSVLIGGIVEGFNLISSVDLLLDKLFEVKKLAKIPSGSNYAIERAKLSASDSVLCEGFDRTVFIQEPDESLSYLIRTALELQGYEVLDKFDTESACHPSIIIMDSGDELSGLEILRKMKHGQEFVNTKFIVTSSIHDKYAILDSGADLYLPKPYEISDLIRWVEHFLR